MALKRKHGIIARFGIANAIIAFASLAAAAFVTVILADGAPPIFPLLAVLFGIFVFYLAASSLAVNKFVVRPLRRLTGSLDREEDIAGLDRRDEFGELAGIIRENMLRARDEKEQAVMVFKTNPICCILWDDNFNFIDCNKEVVRLFGLRSKKEYGKCFRDLSPEYQSNGKRSIEEWGRMADFALKNGRICFEWMHQRLDGTPLPVEIVLDRVPCGGKFLLCAYERDLREQLKVSAGMKYQNALMHTVNNVAETLFCSESEDFSLDLWKCMGFLGTTVSIDRISIWKNYKKDGELHCIKLLEWSENPDIRRITGRVTDISYKESIPGWKDPLSGGQSVKGLVRNTRGKEQKQLSSLGVLSFLSVPIFAENKFWGFLGFDDHRRERDFTAMEESCLRSGGLLIVNALIRKEIQHNLINARESALAASQAKSDFLSNMSHEIRTPMNAIIGMTDIGKAAVTVERKDYAFGKIGDASAHLLGVINDILDMSKIEAGKFELVTDEFDFEKILQRTVEVIAFRVKEKRQILSVDIGRGIPRFVVGDGQRLAQVIANLLSNAVKFTPEEGAIALKAFLLEKEGGGCAIQVEVVDSGIGISEEQQERLFHSFVQAESSTSRKYGGTGLGLVISKRIVEMMNGRIWIESEPGKGSKFAFFVRLKEGSEPEKKALSGQVRIFVVDDDPHVLDFFAEIASRHGVACDTAPNAEKALELLKNGGSYDVYFVDWKLPGMDGLELSGRILADTGKEKPVVILTSAADWDTIEKDVKNLGINSFLSKPLFPSPIIDCINRCLGTEDGTEAAAGKSGGNAFGGRRVLVVDDVDINREILSSILEESGIEISCASNGEEAVRMYTENPGAYDLIFMDLQMPGMDGYEATSRVRAHEAERREKAGGAENPPLPEHIPIIAMTANAFREDIEKCLASGMDDHVGKPVNLKNLHNVLEKYLGNAGR